jgi:hypothetical protein
MKMKQKHWAFINLIAFLGMLTVNYLANALPIAGRSTGAISGMYPNLFVPAGFTFSIWGVIYLALIGFVAAGFFQKYEEEIKAIGPLFVISCAANIAWLFAFHHLWIKTSMVFMVILLATLITLYQNLWQLKQQSGRSNWISVPFSIYLGWISVATIANTAITLMELGIAPETPLALVLTITVISVAIILALLMLQGLNDYFYSLVVIWALFGIYSKRMADVPANDLSLEYLTVFGMAFIAAWMTFKVTLKWSSKLN